MNVKCDEKLAESPEHVPLLITPSAASEHQKPSVATTTINIPTNVTNGNGLIDSGDQHQRPLQITPVVLSSSTPALVMRSRLNQYKASGGNFKSNIIVNYDGDSGKTAVSKASARSKKKQKPVDI